MSLDINALVAAHAGQSQAFYRGHVNPHSALALTIIGFARTYVRAKGAYLWDDTGWCTLDMMGGRCLFNIGGNHLVGKQALADYMAEDGSSLARIARNAVSPGVAPSEASA